MRMYAGKIAESAHAKVLHHFFWNYILCEKTSLRYVYKLQSTVLRRIYKKRG